MQSDLEKLKTTVGKALRNFVQELDATVKEILKNADFLGVALKAVNIEIESLKFWQIKRRLKLMKHRRFLRRKLKQAKQKK